MTTEGAPSSAAESEPCIFCGDPECEWIRAANEAGRIDWHPPTVMGTVRPDLAAGLGKMQVLRNSLGRLSIILIPDETENGALFHARLAVRRDVVQALAAAEDA